MLFLKILKQQAFFEKLQQARVELNTWKRKGKKLLYSMLPAKIARKIENGVEPNTICEVILYQDTFLFTKKKLFIIFILRPMRSVQLCLPTQPTSRQLLKTLI